MNIKIVDGSNDKNYFTMIPNYVLNHSTHWDREVYIQMKRFAGENGTCWASQNTLAKQCGISVHRLKKSLKYLIEHNWIKKLGIKQTETSGGKQSVIEYVLTDLWNLNNGFYQQKKSIAKGVPPSDIPSQRGILVEGKGVSPETYKEEPLNKKENTSKEVKTTKEELLKKYHWMKS